MNAHESLWTFRYSSSNQTDYYSPGEWNGLTVMVHELLWPNQGACPGHVLEPMTHFGERTGELYCPYCCGITGPVEGLECDFNREETAE